MLQLKHGNKMKLAYKDTTLCRIVHFSHFKFSKCSKKPSSIERGVWRSQLAPTHKQV